MKIEMSDTDKQIIAKHSQDVRGRALLELIIVDALIQAAKKYGYRFEIDDRDEDEDNPITDDGLKLALFNRDDAVLNVYQRTVHLGWIRLVFGNNGYDLISDYSVNLESFLKPVNDIARFWGN